jgi:hypothetical protein
MQNSECEIRYRYEGEPFNVLVGAELSDLNSSHLYLNKVAAERCQAQYWWEKLRISWQKSKPRNPGRGCVLIKLPRIYFVCHYFMLAARQCNVLRWGARQIKNMKENRQHRIHSQKFLMSNTLCVNTNGNVKSLQHTKGRLTIKVEDVINR